MKGRGNEKGVWLLYVGEAERGGVNVRRGGMEGDAQQPYSVDVYLPFCKITFV